MCMRFLLRGGQLPGAARGFGRTSWFRTIVVLVCVAVAGFFAANVLAIGPGSPQLGTITLPVSTTVTTPVTTVTVGTTVTVSTTVPPTQPTTVPTTVSTTVPTTIPSTTVTVTTPL